MLELRAENTIKDIDPSIVCGFIAKLKPTITILFTHNKKEIYISCSDICMF